MKKLIFLLLTLSFFSCKDDEPTDSIDLRNTLGEITMELVIENDRWGKPDLNVVLTLKNDPKANPELEKYLKDVGGQEPPTELSVDWGDGTVNSQTAHTYADNGNYKVVIKGQGINWFSVEKIFWKYITYVDIQKCPTLQGVIFSSSLTRPSDGKYSFSDYPYLEYIGYVNNPFTKILDISQNKYLKGLSIYGSGYDLDYGVDLSSLPGLKFVLMQTSDENMFDKISKSKSIEYLSFSNNTPPNVNLSGLTQLEELVVMECKFNDYNDLDLSKNLKLKKVNLNHKHNSLVSSFCPYTDEIMNKIYSKLPSVVGGVLTTNIPFGDKSIAEKRGWSVTTVAE